MTVRLRSLGAGGVSILIAAFAAAQQPASHEPATQVSGTIRVWGSTQMSDLLAAYEKGFRALQPDVSFENDLRSTLTAVPAVYTGRADVGLLGREIWPTEVQAFESVAGKPPEVVEIATGSYDVPKATYALMVYVPTANPIRSLSMADLERIFGASERPARTWGDVGLHGRWAKRSIHLYGFSIDNDKAQIFRQLVFRKDEQWNCSLRQFRNGAAPDADAGGLILQAIAKDPDAIGISNVHFATSSVRALPLTTAEHLQPIAPSKENVVARAYPLSRAVFMVISKDSLRSSPGLAQFMGYVLSEQGREAVVKEGNYLPLPPEIMQRELRKISGE